MNNHDKTIGTGEKSFSSLISLFSSGVGHGGKVDTEIFSSYSKIEKVRITLCKSLFYVIEN